MRMISGRAAPLCVFLAVSTNIQVSSFSAKLLNQNTYQSGRRQNTSFHVPKSFRHGMISPLYMTASPVDVSTGKFIETELRGAAMKLHTRSQAPKEGQAEEKTTKPYVTKHQDYLQFLVDSQHVYRTFEEVVNSVDGLGVFRNTGLERVEPLEKDIAFMVEEYNLVKPEVTQPGLQYAELIRNLGKEDSIPEFLCHFFNFYFAHTAGGRMIGKQIAALLLDKKTLAFYQWDGDLNEIKSRVKGDIENLVSNWSREQKDRCVQETHAAFEGGGALNSHLSGGQSSH